MGARTASEANSDRWSAEDDAWRGYHRNRAGQVVLDDRTEQVRRLLVPRPGGALLDVGCANGVLTEAYAKVTQVDRVVGVDGVDLGVAFPFILVDLDAASSLPLPDGQFDVVVCLETIEHVHDTDRLVKELRRVLRPDGYAVLSVPRIDGFVTIAMLLAGYQPPAIECSLERRYGAPGGAGRVSGHVSHFTRRSFVALLEANGLKVEAVRQAGVYTSWVHAVENPSRLLRAPLWMLSKLPFKQDVTIVRVVKR